LGRAPEGSEELCRTSRDWRWFGSRFEERLISHQALSHPRIGRMHFMFVGDPVFNANRIRINTFALSARLPTVYSFRELVEAGGLMSYGPNIPDLFRRAASYVDKILRGAKPAEIPVEQPIKFDLIINITTAKALGITIPEPFLLRADEVVE